ncbi:cilia- and flagella-associated protein 141-like isoform X2 [Haliotis asinina]
MQHICNSIATISSPVAGILPSLKLVENWIKEVKMSIETTRRFEGPPQGISAGYKQQRARIRLDEEMAEKAAQIRLEKQINERALWNQELEEKSGFKKHQENKKRIQEELRMASRAAIAVRRVALKNLMEKEFAMYTEELKTLGKTFYKQRV